MSARVSIAFRRSPRSPHSSLGLDFKLKVPESPLPFGVLRVHHKEFDCITPQGHWQSPLPFGVLRVHHWNYSHLSSCNWTSWSPLPFGVLRVHHRVTGDSLHVGHAVSPLPFGVL